MLFPVIQQHVEESIQAFNQIHKERKILLKKLAEVIRLEAAEHQPLHLQFICTHNSRRSQLAQLAGNVAAEYYGMKSLHFHSGGTEATALHPNAVKAIQRMGFRISELQNEVANPRYVIHVGQDSSDIYFSKLYDESIEDGKQFLAVMTCNEADANCPMVRGALKKIALPYDDPKASDDSDMEMETYDRTLLLIMTELLYTFSLLQ